MSQSTTISPDPIPFAVEVRCLAVRDFPRITELGRVLYPDEKPWRAATLQSQLDEFARGQLVAVDPASREVVGYAASLIISWEDYGHYHTWNEITASGTFRTHDPTGRTLYGADVMVDPACQGRGVGKAIYAARRQMCIDLNLRRIRAMARLRDYHRHHQTLSASAYVDRVVASELRDPTLTFQLGQGFEVVDVVDGYLVNDPESMGFAAVIEWLNKDYLPLADIHPDTPVTTGGPANPHDIDHTA
jgi:GNAT superfamily N-acetyltransferase